MTGYGFYDAAEYEPQSDDTKWIIEDILPVGFGFIAGLPKGSNSPHGGKSVFFRSMAYSIVTGEDFLGHKVLKPGNVLCVNIDETIDDQIEYFRRLCGDKVIKGFKVSKARSLNMPNDLVKLKEDIDLLKPVFCNIDPLLRTAGGKNINESQNTSPIMTELKKLFESTECTIALNHHSTKNSDRDKESSATWLNGSVDLDSAWDFCVGIEYARSHDYMHARCFFRKRPVYHVYYDAETKEPNNKIIGLREIPPNLKDSKQARKIYNKLQENPEKSLYSIGIDLSIPDTTLREIIREKFDAKDMPAQAIINSTRKGVRKK